MLNTVIANKVVDFGNIASSSLAIVSGDLPHDVHSASLCNGGWNETPAAKLSRLSHCLSDL